MKTAELIRQLNKIDPSGELECCVGNIDIWFVAREPAYYDGALQVFIYDDKGNISAAEIRRRGVKVNLFTMSIEERLMDYPDLPVTVDDNNPRDLARVEKWRAEAKDV